MIKDVMVTSHAVTREAFQAEGKGRNRKAWLVFSGSSKENRATGVDGARTWLEMRSESVVETLAFPEWEQEYCWVLSRGMMGSDIGFKGVTLAAALRIDLGKPELKWRPGRRQQQ